MFQLCVVKLIKQKIKIITMATTKWALDPTHSEIGFKVKHLMFTNVSGNFKTFTASAETEGDSFSSAKIDFSADTNSISTNNEQRDEHLKGTDFFDATAFPKITFNGSNIGDNGDGEFKLTGNLNMHGVSHPIKLNVEFGGIVKDPW